MCQYTTLLLLAGLIILVLIWFDCSDINRNKSRYPRKNYKEKFTNLLTTNKPIHLLDNFISSSICDELVELAKPRFKTSTVYSTNQGSVDMSARSSSCSYFKRGENDLIKSIESQVASLLSIDLKQIEPLQIVRYEKGQQYKYHYDYFGKETDQKKNQRLHSILVYLNDLDEVDGGSTHFPLLKIRTYPYKGRAVLWNNLSADGTENNLTLHAGEPVLNDKIKYVLTIWTRVSEY
jgi:prolyl 4-hydroxylase